MNGSSLPQGVLDGRPQQFIQVTSCLPKKRDPENLGPTVQVSQVSVNNNNGRPDPCLTRVAARPVFNRVVKAKVAVLRFWSDSSGSMSQLHLAVPWGRNLFPGFSVGGCCGLVVFVGASRWVLVVNVTSKGSKGHSLNQLETVDFVWRKLLEILKGSPKIFETHTLSYTHTKKKRLDSCTPKNIRLSKCFSWENPKS